MECNRLTTVVSGVVVLVQNQPFEGFEIGNYVQYYERVRSPLDRLSSYVDEMIGGDLLPREQGWVRHLVWGMRLFEPGCWRFLVAQARHVKQVEVQLPGQSILLRSRYRSGLRRSLESMIPVARV